MKITRFVTSLAAVLVVGTTLVAAGCGGKDDVPPNSVAVVDGTVITQADLDALLERAKKSYAGQKRAFPKAGTSDYTALQNQAVAYLVQRIEYDKEAAKRGVEVTPAEIDKRVAEVTKTYFNGDKAKLQKQLVQQGYTDATFRDDIRAQIVSEKVYADVTKGVTVTDADVQAYYDQNKTQYVVSESREVRHILLAEKNKDGSIDYAASKAKADEVERRLRAGEDFAKLAKEFSQDPGSAASGGKLTVQKGQTVAAFEKASFALKGNEISAPIKTEFGYHVIQALGPLKPSTTTPLASASAQIRSQLLETKKNKAVQDWIAGLEKEYKSKITYSTGFAPPATTAQTTG